MSEIDTNLPQRQPRNIGRIALIAALVAAFVAFLAATSAREVSTQKMHTMPDGSVMPADEMNSSGSK